MTTWKADFGCCFSENADTFTPYEIIKSVNALSYMYVMLIEIKTA
ncbi:hypothetical protein [Bacteroides uniformis]|nr:hypothetical protein [Bacteroides uniformis]